MSVQVKRRREGATFLSTFTGAQGELIVDTTNNRVQVHDGATPGGWPAARLDEVVTRGAAPPAARVSNFMFTPGFPPIWRLDTAHPKLPRTSAIASISLDVITLNGTSDANLFFESSFMTGVSYVRIWNVSKTPNLSAWIKNSPAANQLQVTSATDLAAWSANDIVQIGDPALSTGAVAIDISPALKTVFGTVFPQTGAVVKGTMSGVSGIIGVSSSGDSGSFNNLQSTAVGDQLSGTLITSCDLLSPISNSNLIFIQENVVAPNLLGTTLISLVAVFA